MATDGTYYIPDENGITPVGNRSTPIRLDLYVQLIAGSGTATLTIEAQSQLDGSWYDVTSDTFGQGWFRAKDGATEDYHLSDGLRLLSAYPAVRGKVVLDTSGADDADYSAAWKRVDLR